MSPARKPTGKRTRPPRPGSTKKYRFPDFQIQTLDNGLRVYLSPYPRGPLVHQLLILPGGGQQDPIDRAGLATLTASLMDEGTDHRGALEIAQQIETLGGYLSSQADWDSMSASLGVLAKHGRQGLELLAEIVRGASFPPQEVERLRDQYLAELKRRQAQPSTLASDALFQILYNRTIYATPVIGTPATMAAIRRPEILETAKREISPAGAALVIVGDLEPDSVLSLVEETFCDWRGRPRSEPATIDPAHQDEMRICLVDRPHAPQTELWLGSVSVGRSHPDRAGLTVLNSLLGGKFTSRINLNLRERLGITYGASTAFSRRRGPGPFVVAASIETAAVESAVREILGEIRRLQDELVTDEELADTQSYLLGIFPYTLQRIEGLADRLADLATYDLPRDHFDSYLRQISTVTREDLQKLAQKHFHPDKMGVVAVGPRREIETQLSPFGPLEIRPAQGSLEATHTAS
jgi:zinc protease